MHNHTSIDPAETLPLSKPVHDVVYINNLIAMHYDNLLVYKIFTAFAVTVAF